VDQLISLGLSGAFAGPQEDLGLDEYLFHDAAACLVIDGRVVAAAEEERFNRIKKTTKFPVNAIAYCLAKAGVTPEQVDKISYYYDEEVIDEWLTELYLFNLHTPATLSREFIKRRLEEHFDWAVSDKMLTYVPHHRAHALSVLAHSGQQESLVAVMDGTGGANSSTIFLADGDVLKTLASYPTSKSLGIFYGYVTFLLGYKWGDEYKVMGLAPYGDRKNYRDLFDDLYTLKPDGDYDLDFNEVKTAYVRNGLTPRRAGEPITQQHKDIAAAAQEAVERIALHMLTYWREATGQTSLCFSGGVAHNSTLNGKILRCGLFDEIFIHPASHDASAAVGAALEGHRRLTGEPRLINANWGPPVPADDKIEQELRTWAPAIRYRRCDDIVSETARLLADDAVIGWVQAGSEFGPRALGNRSILADARPAKNKDRINSIIKNREGFRPFAPVVPEEDAKTYFDLPPVQADYEFMSFVVPVLPEQRSELGAVTHVDGSARMQIVTEDSNEKFYRLVKAFGAITGTPVILNTSFNNDAEPIVETVHDAITTYLTTRLTHLIIGDYLITRTTEGKPSLGPLTAELRPSTRLAETTHRSPGNTPTHKRTVYFDHSTTYGEGKEISQEAFALLRQADGQSTLDSLAGGTLPPELEPELYELWRRRFITLKP
jgi:predicted NodU family carbamoyl transferase